MKERSEKGPDALIKIMGLGERSYRKSYYPELQQRMFELERFKALLDQSNDMIFLIQIPGGRLVYTSHSVSAHLGYPPEELLENSLQSLLPQQATRWLEAFFAARSPDAQKLDVLVTSLLNRSGGTLPVEMTLRLVAFQDIEYCVAVARDITERKQAEDALRRSHDELEKRVAERTAELVRSNQELERSNQALQEFTSIASHDLQEPLRKIEAFSERLSSRCASSLGPEGCDYLERMQKASKRMKNLISSLLDYSRVTTKAEPFIRVDLNRTVNAVLNDLEFRIEAEQGRVEVGELPAIDGDPNQMRQLFQNLIGNALKYHGDARPIVHVYAATDRNDFCEIHVKDNGIGFEEKYVERIFAPFQRLHGRGKYEGTGMGLAICKKIVERHGGRISAKSAPGEGTIFIVALPLSQSDDKTFFTHHAS